MQLFSEEVKDMNELNEVLKNNANISKDYKVAVIIYAFDKEKKIIFQRRGPACRDERFKLETIGGTIKDNDVDFRSALNREIIEEVGNNANIKIEEFIISTYAKTFDLRCNKEQDWIYLAYKGSYISGELEVSEPTKNLGYEKYKIGDIDEKELSNGAKELYNIVKERYT